VVNEGRPDRTTVHHCPANEPFGLVMVEAMACGTPVLALPGGSVPEVVRDGVSGYICRSVREMAKRLENLNFSPRQVRQYVVEPEMR
jgi:glycosyltransferase involved in cell wall biosynthesis